MTHPITPEKPMHNTSANIDAIYTAKYAEIAERILVGDVLGEGEALDHPLHSIIHSKERVSGWEQLDRSVELHQRIFERAGIQLPSLEQVIESGVDIEQMRTVFEVMQREGLDPQIVMIRCDPVSKSSVTIDDWSTIYDSYESTAVQGTGVFGMGSPSLIKPPIDVAGTNNINLTDEEIEAFTNIKTDDERQRNNWLICLMTATSEYISNDRVEEALQKLGITDEEFYCYPRVSHYLTYQALRIEQGLKPIGDIDDDEYVCQIDITTPGRTVLQAGYVGTGTIRFDLVDPVDDMSRRGYNQIIYF